ncbi:protein RKD5-like isoform X1 [Triticum urartu]|uniref:protein RKD5-like isoform X1 n=1 Tax=Triticum urartu TaxID=4572 RepID=UPI00204431B4|nr:protein RKD5-like isoform X1 [Triticum urartu]
MDAAAAAVTTLSALAVFASTLHQGAVRSVHGYRVVAMGGRCAWDRWVEREFAFSPTSCREVPLPAAAPRILPVEWRGRPAYREGQVLGAWRCVLAFDSIAAVPLPPTPPPMLCPFRNPGLVCVPSLYNDLYMVYQFQKFQQAPELVKRDSDEKSTRLEAEDKTSDVEVKEESGSDSDEDPQSGEDAELPAHVERRRRAKKQHIASITLADIAPYFHLPIREASRALKIGVSILKQKCRQYGIPRWPHRKIKSLDSLISDLEFVMDDTDGDVVQKETRRQREKEREKEKEKEKQEAIQALAKRKRLLESEKEIIQQKPALDLMAETKLFREDVFKRRYRAKRLPGQ